MERECSDEHEEGEIIDDFEDISDYSMPSSSNSGKSVSHQDLLQDVSLSSISDNEQDSLIYVNTYNSLNSKQHKRKRKIAHHRRRKRQKSSEYYSRHRLSKYVSLSSRASSSDIEIDSKTQKQLKDAVHIERSHIHHNSLRTRLKAMLQNENVKDKSEDEDTLRTLALLSHPKDDVADEEKNKLNNVESADDKDEELIELRLAALKSAVLRKAPEIRLRKSKQKLTVLNDKICEINKENDVNQENNIKDDNITTKEFDNLQIIHNDIEISNETSKNISIEEDIDIMRAKLLASMSKKITNVPKESVIIKIPKENKLDTRNPKLATQQKHTFLKQQIKVKPIIINLNDSDSDTDMTTKKDRNDINDKDINLVNSVSEFLRKQRAAVEAKAKVDSIAQVKSNALDKSVLRLLPKSQQKEYRLLKQKLLIARRKRIRKNSQKNENKINVVVKKSAKEAISKEEASGKLQQESTSSGLKKALLDDIHVKRNGRLQMKGKYKALAPLLQKVTQASFERKQCEFEIKGLLESLQKARDRLAVSHQNYTNLMMRLTAQKNVIDRRANKTHNMKIINNNAIIAINGTSTPLKSNIQEPVCDISSIHNSQDNVKEGHAIISDNAQGETKEVSFHAVCNNDPLVECDNESNTLKQYVSPLDSKNRDTVEDPLITFCPFELFGVCKDPECKFNHCSKT